ncbi:sensor histidine kinase [Aquimonas sp.]|jgi:signal transduction histidine kinase|uniref:sensor histidine kinase n=1 Tax=Aquimonas sp. TaxID=1872588 RepID=UPI0037C01690
MSKSLDPPPPEQPRPGPLATPREAGLRGLDPEAEGDETSAESDAALKRMLAARDRTIDVLIKRLEERSNGDPSAFALLEQNIALEAVVSRKTRELDRERHQLHSALAELHSTQARLLQSQKMEAIGQLAAGVAHEINTPIQYVSDNVSFLRSGFDTLLAVVDQYLGLLADARQAPLSSDRLDAAEAALKAARLDYLRRNVPDAFDESQEGLNRVSGIVMAMKRFSHPSGEDMEPVELSELINTTAMVARNEWKYVADLETAFDANLPPVPCFRDEISQVVLNLIVNASHAIADVVLEAPGTKGRILISTRRVDEFAEIRIADTGGGIPEAIQRSVFDPFFTTKPVGKGTGQGLSMAYSTVVNKHKGRLFFETDPGHGTSFCIHLPLQAAAADEEGAA